MKLRTCGLLAIAALVFCFLASAQSLAQNAYITNYNSNNVSVIDTATSAVTATITVGSHPYGVAVTPDGSKIYVANVGSNSVSVIDTATNTVTATIAVGIGPLGVAVTPDGSKVYVTSPDYSQGTSACSRMATWRRSFPWRRRRGEWGLGLRRGVCLGTCRPVGYGGSLAMRPARSTKPA